MMVLLAVLLLTSSTIVSASSSKSVTTKSTEKKALVGGDLSVTVKECLDGKAKELKNTGVIISITNSGKDFSGTVQITQVDTMYGQGNTVTEREVLIASGETKELIMPIRAYEREISFSLDIVNSTGKTILSQKLDSTLSTANTSYIGIFSEDVSQLNYFSNSFINVISMDEKNFPSDASVLGWLDVIVINNYDTNKLSAIQYETLKKWVQLGGTLAVGTGENYTKTLGLFKDDFIAGTYNTTQSRDTSFGLTEADVNTITSFSYEDISSYNEIKAITHTPNNATEQKEKDILQGVTPEQEESTTGTTSVVPSVKKEMLDLTITGAFPCVTEGSNLILQRKEYGKGVIELMNTDLGLDNTLWSTLGNQITRILYSCMADERKIELISFLEGYGRGNGLDYTLGSGDSSTMPKTSMFFVILALYLVICGPVLYIVLKRFGKRDYLWGAVPAVAILFTLIITSIGSGNKYRAASINYIHYMFMSNSDSLVEEVQMSVMTPSNKNYTIQLGDGFTGNLADSYDSYYSNGNESYGGTQKIVSFGEENSLKINAATSFGKYSFGASRIRKQEGNYSSTLEYEGTRKLVGQFTNQTGYDFTNCAIISNDKIYVLGKLDSGSSVDASKSYTSTHSGSLYWNDGVDQFIGTTYDEQNRTQRLQFETIEMLYQKYCYVSNRRDEVFVGLVSDTADRVFSDAVSMKSNGISLVVIPMNIAINEELSSTQDSINLDDLLVAYSHTMDQEQGTYYTQDVEYLVCKYQMPDSISNGTLNFTKDSYGNKTVFEPVRMISAYNFTTQGYDIVWLDGEKGDALGKDHINGEKQFILKYDNPLGTEKEAFSLPSIVLEGGE